MQMEMQQAQELPFKFPYNELRIIIIDDEPDAVKLLQLQLAQNCPQIEVIATHTSSIKASNEIEHLQSGLLFIEVEMPVIIDFELLKKILHTKSVSI